MNDRLCEIHFWIRNLGNKYQQFHLLLVEQKRYHRLLINYIQYREDHLQRLFEHYQFFLVLLSCCLPTIFCKNTYTSKSEELSKSLPHQPNITTPPVKIKPNLTHLKPQLRNMAAKALPHGSNQLLLPFNEPLLRSNEKQIRLDLSHIELNLHSFAAISPSSNSIRDRLSLMRSRQSFIGC